MAAQLVPPDGLFWFLFSSPVVSGVLKTCQPAGLLSTVSPRSSLLLCGTLLPRGLCTCSFC